MILLLLMVKSPQCVGHFWPPSMPGTPAGCGRLTFAKGGCSPQLYSKSAITLLKKMDINISIYQYVYVYIYMCVCVH